MANRSPRETPMSQPGASGQSMNETPLTVMAPHSAQEKAMRLPTLLYESLPARSFGNIRGRFP